MEAKSAAVGQREARVQRRRLSKERGTRQRRSSTEASEVSATPPPVADMAAIARCRYPSYPRSYPSRRRCTKRKQPSSSCPRPRGGGGSHSLLSLFLFILSLTLSSLPSAASATCRADVKLSPSKSSGKADIVWWIDTSSSMKDAAKYVKANINDFATYIETAGIDYRIILVGQSRGSVGVCIKPPLGAPGTWAAPDFACKKSNLPKYTYVDALINSRVRQFRVIGTPTLPSLSLFVCMAQRAQETHPKPPPAQTIYVHALFHVSYLVQRE